MKQEITEVTHKKLGKKLHSKFDMKWDNYKVSKYLSKIYLLNYKKKMYSEAIWWLPP